MVLVSFSFCCLLSRVRKTRQLWALWQTIEAKNDHGHAHQDHGPPSDERLKPGHGAKGFRVQEAVRV